MNAPRWDPWEGMDDEPGEQPAPPGDSLTKLRALLVDTSGLDDIPEPEPLIPDILNRDSLAWIFGAPGSMKSFVALDIAGCVATGESWQGYGATEPGDVLYVLAEGVSGTKKRVRAWEKATGIPMTGVKFLPAAIQAAQAGPWGVLIDLAAEVKPTLIVIDTQARVTAGMEENSAKDMGIFVDRCEQLRLATGACVLVIHHTGRSGDHMRGSIAMDGAGDTLIKVEKADDRITLKNTKQKNGEEFADISLRPVPMGDSLILAITDGRPSGDVASTLSWRRKWWEHFRDDPVSVSVLEKTGVISSSAFYRQRWALINSSILRREGVGNGTRYVLTVDPDA